MRENYFDGEWRPVIDMSDIALDKLRNRGFVFGADKVGHLMARWPIAPAAPAITFTGIPLDYWREEVRLGCAASLGRLRGIVRERGGDWEKTIEQLKGESS